MPNEPRPRLSFDPEDTGENASHRRAEREPRPRDLTPAAKRRGGVTRDTAPTKPTKIKPTKLRIIGGQMRGRGIIYMGDRSTRPMKDSIRETLFNILGKAIKGTVALDLFAGTGVLAIESLSRGSVKSVAIEKLGNAAKVIRSSADAIGIGDELSVLTGDSFRLAPARMRELATEDQSDLPSPWVVYFCPPYAMWTDMTEKMFELLQLTVELAPVGSHIVAETDKYFDVTSFPFEDWDIRRKGNVTLSFLEVLENHKS